MDESWKDVDVDGLPILDGEAVYIGVNTSGYVAAFNMMNGDGMCLSGTAEGCVAVMSCLKYWRRHVGPGTLAAEPDAALRLSLPPLDEQELLRLARGLALTCRAYGRVLSVEQQPLQPLAMGHYATVARILPGRGVVA